MKVLIVRLSSLGDVVHNMPMVDDILRHCPTAQIDWVVEEAYTSLVRLNPGVHNVIPVALRRWRKTLFSAGTRTEMQAFRRALQKETYDVIFDTQGLVKSAIVMRMARLASGGLRVGLANATEDSGYEAASRLFHTMSVPVGLRTHAVLRARLVAAAALQYTVDKPVHFNLQVPATQPSWMPASPYAVFFHGTARAAKQWVPANWIRLGAVLAARGLIVLLPWGSEEEKLAAHSLAAQIPNAQVLPKLPLMEAVMLAQSATLVIGVDTGLTHVAAAYYRPTIELYCDSPRWKTQGDWSDNIVNLGDTGQPPSVEQVIMVAEQLLGPVDKIPACAG